MSKFFISKLDFTPIQSRVLLINYKRNLIFEYPTSSNSHSFKTILATLKGINSKSIQNDSIYEISLNETVYKIKNGKLNLFALIISNQTDTQSNEQLDNHDDDDESKDDEVSRTLNPNLFFVFLDRLLALLTDYFGSPLSPIKIEANYDTVCNLFQELIEGGFPYITDNNTLKTLVPFKQSFGDKLISKTNQLARGYTSSSSLQTQSNISENSIPWRKQNVRYTNNELFVDIKEEINIILSHHQPSHSSKSPILQQQTKLKPSVAIIKGSIEFTSHLSGTPDIQLILNLNGHYLGIPSFHRCVKTNKWDNSPGSLSFIPPDGKTIIMDYTVELDQYPASKIQRYSGLVNVDYRKGLGPNKNEFEIVLNLGLFKNVTSIDGLKIDIQLSDGERIKILRLSHGDFQTRPNGQFQWIFDEQTSLGISPILRGVIELENEIQGFRDENESSLKVFPKLISVSYSNKGSLPSGIRVDSLNIIRGISEVKPYKGVKYLTTTGDYFIR